MPGLPLSIPRFVCQLPRLVNVESENIVDLGELAFEFDRTYLREYAVSQWPGGSEEDILAAKYAAVTELGTVEFGMIFNAESGEDDAVMKAVLTAVAKNFCFHIAYDYPNQTPTAPAKPDNPGYSEPISNEAMERGDGTLPLRGFCAGVSPVDVADIDDVDVYISKYFVALPS